VMGMSNLSSTIWSAAISSLSDKWLFVRNFFELCGQFGCNDEVTDSAGSFLGTYHGLYMGSLVFKCDKEILGSNCKPTSRRKTAQPLYFPTVGPSNTRHGRPVDRPVP
jgi:hypothetical protein